MSSSLSLNSMLFNLAGAFVLLLSTGVFLLCYRPDVSDTVSRNVRDHYNLFVELNRWMARLFGQELANENQAYQTSLGVALMRFIAFAYTYHYLNWFSKTSIIRWHEMGGKRLAFIGALWLASIGLYFYDFPLAVRADGFVRVHSTRLK